MPKQKMLRRIDAYRLAGPTVVFEISLSIFFTLEAAQFNQSGNQLFV